MEHIFYLTCLPAPGFWLPAPGCLSPVFLHPLSAPGFWGLGRGDWVPTSPFMDRILFEFNNNFSIWFKWSTEKFLCFFRFISLPEHGFSIFTRKLAKFYPNLMSKIRAQNRRIYPVLPSKTHHFSSLMSKRLCSISPLPAGSFHYFEHKNTKKMIRISFHFKIPDFGGQKSPVCLPPRSLAPDL
jgi:hypothetical protein